MSVEVVMLEWAERRRDWLAALAVLSLVLASLVGLKDVGAEHPFGAKLDVADGRLTLAYLRDFPAHLRFARSVWVGPIDFAPARQVGSSCYSAGWHRKVMVRWLGPGHADRALPFGYSPTMLFLLAPLTPMSDVWAFGVWTALGWLAAWWACRSVSPMTSLLIILTPLAARSQALGQTAILSTAGLVFLLLESRRDRPRTLAMSLVLWALTAKPPLAVTAGVALLSLRLWRPVAVAIGISVLTTLAAWPLLGPDWVGDYLAMLTRYNQVRADPLFAWSLGPEYMSSLRSVLSLYLGVPDDLSSRIAGLLWVPVMALVAWRGSWRSAVLVMLLLGPHVNSTEDVALLVVAAASPARLAVLVCVAAWATPGYSPPVGLLWPLPAFLLKVALLVAVVAMGRPGEPAASPGKAAGE